MFLPSIIFCYFALDVSWGRFSDEYKKKIKNIYFVQNFPFSRRIKYILQHKKLTQFMALL